jgi:hypothetical protein
MGPPFLRSTAAPHAGKKESLIVVRLPPQLRFSLYLCAKSKSRKKRDHGESQAVLFALRNKFPALPKRHNLYFEQG